jgi:hypothetical protein
MGLYTSPNEDLLGRITPDGTVTNFILGTQQDGIDGLFSGGMAVGAGGNFWCSLQSHGFVPGQIYQVNPDGQLVGTIGTAHGLGEMTTGPDGTVWGVERGDDGGELVERITPDGTVTDFPFPTQTGDRLHNFGMGVTTGPDGNVWFTEPVANQIGLITPDGQITEYQVPTPDSHPTGITTGPDGNIWFAELGSGQIGEFVLNNGGGAAPRSAARLAQAVRLAADAQVNGAPAESPNPVAAAPPAAVAAIDAAYAAALSEESTRAPDHQPVGVSGLVAHARPVGMTQSGDAALADPLGEAP